MGVTSGGKVFTSRVVSLPRSGTNPRRLLARLHKDIITHSLAPNGVKSAVVFRLSRLHLSPARHGRELKRAHNRGLFMETRRCRERVEQNIINFPVYAFAQSYSFPLFLFPGFACPMMSTFISILYTLRCKI